MCRVRSYGRVAFGLDIMTGSDKRSKVESVTDSELDKVYSVMDNFAIGKGLYSKDIHFINDGRIACKDDIRAESEGGYRQISTENMPKGYFKESSSEFCSYCLEWFREEYSET